MECEEGPCPDGQEAAPAPALEIQRFPRELLLMIFYRLDQASLRRVSCVCHWWYTSSRDSRLWRRVAFHSGECADSGERFSNFLRSIDPGPRFMQSLSFAGLTIPAEMLDAEYYQPLAQHFRNLTQLQFRVHLLPKLVHRALERIAVLAPRLERIAMCHCRKVLSLADCMVPSYMLNLTGRRPSLQQVAFTTPAEADLCLCRHDNVATVTLRIDSSGSGTLSHDETFALGWLDS